MLAALMAQLPPSDVPCLLCGSDKNAHLESHNGDKFRGAGHVTTTVVCQRCGLVYASPQPSASELQELYSGSYGGQRTSGPERFYLDRKNYDAELRVGFITKGLSSEKPGRALEIGAGAGNQLAVLRDRGWDVLGIEPTPGYAAFARDELGVEVVEGYFVEGSFEPESFDLVIMAEVLEHFPDPVSALRAVRMVLRPGGRLYLDVPNVLRPNRFRLSEYLHGDHLTFFSPTTLGLMLRATGFEPIEHRWHYYQYVLAKLTEPDVTIDFAAAGDDYARVIRTLRRPRPHLVLTFAKRSTRNMFIRVLGGRLGPALLRRAVRVRNHLRGW